MPTTQGFREIMGISVSSVEQTGEMLLYGIIGQSDQYGDDVETLTDLAIVEALNQLVAAGCTRINVRINSPGGIVYEGQAIVNALLRCPAEVHTYNDGLAASMAAAIWAAGRVRHMADNALLMLHSASTFLFGNAQVLRAEADNLDRIDQGIASNIAKATGKTAEEVIAALYDGQDHFMTLAEARAFGFDIAEEPYAAAAEPAPVAIAKVAKTRALYAKHSAAALLRNVSNARPSSPTPVAPVAPITAQNSQNLTLEQFNQALDAGTLSVTDVQAALETRTQPPAPAPADSSAELASLRETVAQLTQQVTALATAPGGSASHVPAAPGAGAAQTTDAGIATSAVDSLHQMLAGDTTGRAFQRLD